MASGSFAETTSPPTPCCAAVWMNVTCDVGLASEGPTSAKVPPNSSMASSPPAFDVSKYGLPRFFGRKVMARFASPASSPPPLPPAAHPVRTSAAPSASAVNVAPAWRRVRS
jgi:hypothetical protein